MCLPPRECLGENAHTAELADVCCRAGASHRVELSSAGGGATYLICPAICLDVVAEARALGVPVIPGAYTPSEILAVWRAGASMVKLFPAATGGPAYLQAIRAPLPDIPIVPTGGISLTDASAYIAAGATAVGMGNPLVRDACDGGALDALRVDTALARLNAIPVDPAAGRAPRDAMLSCLDGIGEWLPRYLRQDSLNWSTTT